MRVAAAAIVSSCLVALSLGACRDPAVGGPSPGARRGVCRASSVPSGKSCPERAVPPSNASSARGCRSDADCTKGRQGRCVRFGVSLAPAARSNLLAEAPPPPPETVCAYDECLADADCGPSRRCECGGEGQRYRCVAVDQCQRDADCGSGALCMCGEGAGPNVCRESSCRSDADCAGGYPCSHSEGGRYCQSARDRCKGRADCAHGETCSYQQPVGAFVCVPIPIVPAG